ncbi:MAG: hypothetical protein V2J65_22210 [Desulfobacteraceae bacterium]|nr:hypothetical protein [Desulfobacteraceae bacterium]
MTLCSCVFQAGVNAGLEADQPQCRSVLNPQRPSCRINNGMALSIFCVINLNVWIADATLSYFAGKWGQTTVND